MSKYVPSYPCCLNPTIYAVAPFPHHHSLHVNPSPLEMFTVTSCSCLEKARNFSVHKSTIWASRLLGGSRVGNQCRQLSSNCLGGKAFKEIKEMGRKAAERGNEFISRFLGKGKKMSIC